MPLGFWRGKIPTFCQMATQVSARELTKRMVTCDQCVRCSALVVSISWVDPSFPRRRWSPLLRMGKDLRMIKQYSPGLPFPLCKIQSLISCYFLITHGIIEHQCLFDFLPMKIISTSAHFLPFPFFLGQKFVVTCQMEYSLWKVRVDSSEPVCDQSGPCCHFHEHSLSHEHSLCPRAASPIGPRVIIQKAFLTQ